ncbi:MAG: BamA/TamA family outer membrane protein [Gemmatimonadota bacterium]
MVGYALLGSAFLGTSSGTPVLLAQDLEQDRLARADSARAALVRPPAKPPADFTTVLEVPFKIIGFPFLVLTEGLGFAAGQLTLPRPPSPIVAAIRGLAEDGLTIGVSPSIGPRSGFGATLSLSRFEPFYATSGWSVRGSRQHSAGVRLGDWPKGNQIDVGWSFQHDASPRFWGVGSSTTPDLLSEYEREHQTAGASGRYWLHPSVGLQAHLRYEIFKATDLVGTDDPTVGQTFGPIFGLGETTEYVVAGGSLLLDFTNRVGFQTRGVRLQFDASTYRGADETDSDFHRIGGSANVYLPLNPRQTLAIRGQLSTLRDDGAVGSDGIPFYLLNTLGGSRSSRGFRTDRFTDTDLVAFMGEWRYEVWQELQSRARMEFFIFLDEGAVASRLGDVTSADWHTSYGLGVRFATVDGLAFATFLGFSDEQTRLGFKTGWPF